MASIRSRKGSDFLFVDFQYMNKRCREKTNLIDTLVNRKKLSKIIERMEAEILLGTFVYETYFPKSDKVAYFQDIKNKQKHHITSRQHSMPLFKDFCTLWFSEKQVEWRATYQNKVQVILNKYLLPKFGGCMPSEINRADVLAFRASLGKDEIKHTLSATRINQITATLYTILKEASKRYHFDNPCSDIKSLKVSKRDIQPFSINEVWRFIDGVRADYRSYYITRFFTGMRTSEIDGLMWACVDFDNRLIKVRQALIEGKLAPPKTTESHRDIAMSPFVYDALIKQKQISFGKSDFVFCLQNGGPLDYRNINRRVWHPTLKLLGLKPRNAYQTRHTCATLWLSAGEAPEWIARQMGHINTMMLFKVYSRYVPNATRQDGSAFEMLISSSLTQRAV
ncbi:MAG: DUF3596 domain-containing protein [Moraxella sp.]|nr:DUF3596 domain-containing protein [Moraxella sp.]